MIVAPPKRRGRHPNRTPALVNEPSLNEPAKVSKTIFIKPAKEVKKQAKIVKEHT
jgi:hypothetical protein